MYKEGQSSHTTIPYNRPIQHCVPSDGGDNGTALELWRTLPSQTSAVTDWECKMNRLSVSDWGGWATGGGVLRGEGEEC